MIDSRGLHNIDHRRAARQRLELRRLQRKHAVGMAGGRLDHIEAQQLSVDQRERRLGVRERRNTADREAGFRFDEIGIGSAERSGECCDFLFIDAPVTQLQFDPTIVPVTGPTLLATPVPAPSLRPKRPSRPGYPACSSTRLMRHVVR